MDNQVIKGGLRKDGAGTVGRPARSRQWIAPALFAAGAVLYFADIILAMSGVSAPGWQEYYVNRGLYLIFFSVPFLYCAYIYRVRGVIASIITLVVIFGLRVVSVYPDMLPFVKSLTFTAFLMVLGLLIARYQNIRDKEKQAVRQVEASERRYRALTENVADFIWIMNMDMDLHFTYVNPAVTQLLGYTTKEAVGQKIADILSPDSVEKFLAVVGDESKDRDGNRADDHSHVHILRLSGRHKDGTLLPVEVKVIFVRDSAGRPTEILGVTRVIKKRVAAE